jgi:hypothetical protein
MEMRSAFLIIFLLFGCKQAVNNDTRFDERAIDTVAVKSVISDTLVANTNGTASKDSMMPLREEKIHTFNSWHPDFGSTSSTQDTIYNLISFMTEGPKDTSDDSEESQFFRLVITTSESTYSIYIEHGAMNLRGGGREILLRRLIDDAEFIKKFSIGEGLAHVKFDNWTSWDSFVLNINEVKYIFKDIGNNPMTIQRTN